MTATPMHIAHVQFPLVLPAHPLKRSLKVALGAGLGALLPARVRQLVAGAVGDRLSALDRLLVAHLVHRHERLGSLDRLAPLQRWLWTCDQAVTFHTQAEARFERWWVQGASRIVAPLQAAIDAAPGRYTRLCEVGCGSGLVLNDLRESLRDVPAFVGLDLSPAQIERNRTRFPTLHFAAGDATEWIPRHAEPGWVYLTNAGVLEYLTEPQVVALLTHIARSLSPALFAIAEPVAAEYDLARETESRPFGAERTFSHNYLALFDRCGWTVRWSKLHDVDGCRQLFAVASVE